MEYPDKLVKQIRFLSENWDIILRIFYFLHSMPFGNKLAGIFKSILAFPLFPTSIFERLIRETPLQRIMVKPISVLAHVCCNSLAGYCPKSYAGD